MTIRSVRATVLSRQISGWFCLAALAAAVSTLMLTGASSSGASTGPSPFVSWVGANPLVVSSKVGSSATTTIRNETGDSLVIELNATGPIKVAPATLSIGVAGSAQIAVTVTSTASSSNAWITAVAHESHHCRHLSVSELPVVVGITPIPAVSSVKVQSTWGPFGATVGASIPLTNGPCSTLAYAPNSQVGYVQATSGQVSKVVASCLGSGASTYLRLSFPGLSDTGANYEGDATVGTTKVPISVQRSSTLILPLFALAIGVLLAMWLLRRAPGRVIANLRSRIRLAQAAVGTSDDPGQAVLLFRRLSSGATWGELDLSADVAAIAAEINAQINDVKKRKWFSLQPNDPEVLPISSRIEEVEGIGTSLVTLSKSLIALQNAVPVVESSRLVPLWTTSLESELQRNGPISLAELSTFVAQAQKDEAVALWFPSVAQQVRAAEERIELLIQSPSSRTPEEQIRIETAQGLLTVALAELGQATTSSEVQDAYNDEFTVARKAVEALGAMQVIPVAGFAATNALGGPPSLLSMTLPTPEILTHEAAVIITKEQVASLVAVLIIGAILLFAGLQALVIGKTFGTVWDFVAAIAWGSATLVVASPLAAAIEGFRQIRPR
jgi:hypothetical protein